MTERDFVMTHVLHNTLESLMQEKRGMNASAPIVGRDHIDGIKANWGKVDWVDEEVIAEFWRYVI